MKLKKIIALLLVSVMIFSLSACGAKEADYIVKIGDTGITQDQLDKYTDIYCYIQGVDLTSINAETLAYIKSMTLEDLISLKIVGIYYKNDDSVLPSTYKDSLKKFIAQVNGDSAASAYMKKYKVTEDDLTEFYRDQNFSVPFFDKLKKDIPAVTDAEMQTYYKDHQDEFTADEVTAQHILVADKALAEKILTQLKAGANFAEMAAKYSIDTTTKDKGGSLGTFGRGQMVTEFEDAAFALKAGELSNVVKTKYGYHIILVTAKKQGLKTYAEVKTTIQSTLENSALSTVYQKKIKELRKKYGVEYLKTKTTSGAAVTKSTAGAVTE